VLFCWAKVVTAKPITSYTMATTKRIFIVSFPGFRMVLGLHPVAGFASSLSAHRSHAMFDIRCVPNMSPELI
jgi:hypothetical protein